MKLWQHPSNYFGAVWPATYVFLGRNRDSDCLTNSNFETALKEIESLTPFEDEKEEKTSRIVVTENHWACGWVEWIAIHQDDSAAIEYAEKMEERLENYPVLDEEDWSERENKEAEQVWKNCYDEKERVRYIRERRSEFDFSSFADLLSCVRGKYFAGYASSLVSG